MEMNPSALSPNRMTIVLTDARRMFKEDYTALEKKDLNEIINSKCRSVKQKYRKTIQNRKCKYFIVYFKFQEHKKETLD